MIIENNNTDGRKKTGSFNNRSGLSLVEPNGSIKESSQHMVKELKARSL